MGILGARLRRSTGVGELTVCAKGAKELSVLSVPACPLSSESLTCCMNQNFKNQKKNKSLLHSLKDVQDVLPAVDLMRFAMEPLGLAENGETCS